MPFGLDPKDLSFLGGALSTLLAAFGYWTKTRHEQRRATRTVLYYLLEHHHHVRRAHESVRSLQTKFLAVMLDSLKVRGVQVSDEEWSKVRQQVAPLIRSFVSSEIQENLVSLQEPLERALADLARENPVLAYRLRGRERIMLLNEKITKLAGPDAAPDETALEFFEAFVGEIALGELRKSVYATARACDVLTLVKVHLAMKRQERPDPEEDVEVQTFVDDLVSTFLRVASAPR